MKEPSLQVTELYLSVQGEAGYVGWPCTFIRLTGCPLRCRWCDTVYSFEGGKPWSVSELVEKTKELGSKYVELTGGEPLAQKNTPLLAQSLLDAGHFVMIETGGSEPIDVLPAKVHVIMDIKCPASKMSDRNHWENLNFLKPSDEVKFVIADRNDYEWCKQVINEHKLDHRCKILASPAFGLLDPKTLVDWILEDRLMVRLNLQVHKYIWSPRAKGV